MKLLTTLILMTVSTIAFADVSVNDTNKTDFIYVSKKVHDELDAQYKGMIHSVNSNLYSKPLDEENVKFESTQVIYNNVSCARESLEEKEWCESKRNELVEKLTTDVMKSDEYKVSKAVQRDDIRIIAENAISTGPTILDILREQPTKKYIKWIYENLFWLFIVIAAIFLPIKLLLLIRESNRNNPDNQVSIKAVVMVMAQKLWKFIIFLIMLIFSMITCSLMIDHMRNFTQLLLDNPIAYLFVLAIASWIGYLIIKDVKDLKKD